MIFCTVHLKLLRWIFDGKQHNAFESECVKEAKWFWLNGWISGAKNIGAHMSISWRWYQRGYMDHWLSIRPVRIRQLCAHGLNAISASGAKGQSGAFCVHGNGPIWRRKNKTDACELFPVTARLGHVDAASESWVQLRWRWMTPIHDVHYKWDGCLDLEINGYANSICFGN